MSEVTILDEMLDMGIPEDDATELNDVIAKSREITISSLEKPGKRIIVIRGFLDEKVKVKGEKVGNNILKIGRGYVAIFWKEGVLRWRYIIIAGVSDDYCGGKP